MKRCLLSLSFLSLFSCNEPPTPQEGVFNVASVAAQRSPLDATPSPDGQDIFFVESAGVFTVEGTQVNTLHQGAPLVAARGMAFAPNAQTLYIADPAADSLFAVTFAGAPIDPLEDTQGLSPSAIDVQENANGDVLFFTGIDPQTGNQAVFQKEGDLPPALLFSDDSLGNLDGIAVSSIGQIFLADRANGEIFSLQNGALTSVIANLQTGNPAGIALTTDETTLLISAEDATDGHCIVVIVNLEDSSTSIFEDVIGANTTGGGLHRAQSTDVFAWADFSSNNTGAVFRITPN